MSTTSAIEWTDKAWSPVVGCGKVSPGCQHCYAIRVAHRLGEAFRQPAYEGLTRKFPDGSINWTGEVRTLPDRLEDPLGWKKPQKVFVNSMSDLFHESVPDEFIDRVFAVMAWCPQHTFQILTKRPQRMAAYLGPRFPSRTAAIEVAQCAICCARGGDLCGQRGDDCGLPFCSEPLPNVWLGVSVENQDAADERIPLLLQTPAAVRFLSCEPLLGPLDLSEWLGWACQRCHASYDDVDGDWRWPAGSLRPDHRCYQESLAPNWAWGRRRIDWVITGGESGGPKDRRLVEQRSAGLRLKGNALDWLRSIRDQCQAAGVAYFHKQHGGPTPKSGGRLLDGHTWDEFPEARP